MTEQKLDSVSSKFSISCFDVPSSLLNSTAAKNHFKKFGKIVKINLRTKRNQCIIEFDNQESARKALQESGYFENKTFKTMWTRSYNRSKMKREHKINDKEPNWACDQDIQEELEAMKGSSSNRQFVPRPEVMTIDPNFPKTTNKDSKKLRNWRNEKPVKKKSSEMTSSIINEQAAELLTNIMKCTENSEDKFRVLDARDKLIRLKMTRQSNLANANHTVGTCPDMCPEKERLMRESQHQVAVYEQICPGKNNQMNHAIGVKQYSRSSADQETPLAHELRPVKVLELTMIYLLHCIMDLCDSQDVNLGEWYHFLWDRTRGIRKDITQQELCCQGSVKLVEQCARFHIHCSARLVAEDVSVFDQKINTENLTKCLQTLKYMYHDLSLKNESCPNEAEFRGYIVLLNLNDGNFMWEVQHLNLNIQSSSEVKFAINVYSALDKNNYVRFFKLVKSTTYLNACILLRYFNQVRISAMSRILKSYNTPRQPFMQFPIVELHNILAFEDTENVISFVEYYGLYLNPDKTHIVLDRKVFCQPDIPFLLERAINIIESKRTCSVGEIVCGTKLPEKYFINHIPYNSFDEYGYLKISEIPREWQSHQKYLSESSLKNNEEINIDLEESKQEENLNISSKPFTFSNPDSSGFEMKVKAEMPKSAINFTFTSPTLIFKDNTKLETTKTYTSSVLRNTSSRNVSPGRSIFNNQTIDSVIKPLWQIEHTETKKEINVEPNVDIQEMNADKQSFKSSKLDSINVDNVSQHYFTKKPQSEKLNMDNKSIKNISLPTLDNTSQNSFQTVNFYPIWENVSTVSYPLDLKNNTSVIKTKVLEPKGKLRHLKNQAEIEKNKKNIEIEKAAELVKIRRLELRKRQDELEKKIKEDVTCTINDMLTKIEDMENIQIKLNAIAKRIKNRKILMCIRKWRDNIKKTKRKRKHFFDYPTCISSRTIAEEAQELNTSNQSLTLHDMKRYKLGVSQTIKLQETKSVEKLHIFNLVWKILFEKLNNGNGLLHLNIYWKIGIYLSSNFSNESQKLKNNLRKLFAWKNTNTVTNRYKAINGGTFTTCIKEIELVESNSYNGMILFELDKHICLTYEKLWQILKTDKQVPSNPISLVFISLYSERSKEISDCLKLDELKSEGFISNYKIYYLHEKNKTELILKNALQWLAQHVVKPEPLEMDALITIVRNCICEELWFRFRSSANINNRFYILLKDPNLVINLHNEALNHLIDILCGNNFNKYSKFPNEFKKYLDFELVSLPCKYEYFYDYWNKPIYLQKIKNLLQNMILPLFEGYWPPKDEYKLEYQLNVYCSKLFGNSDICKKILNIFLSKFNFYCQEEFKMKIDNLLWLDILEILVHEKLKLINKSFHNDDGTILTSVYRIEDMKKFRNFPWWYHSNLVSDKIKTIVLQDNTEIVEPEIAELFVEHQKEINLDETLQNLYEVEDSVTGKQKQKMINEIQNLSELIEDLEESMKIQRKIICRFDETIKLTLKH